MTNQQYLDAVAPNVKLKAKDRSKTKDSTEGNQAEVATNKSVHN
jgi:hypothetical protein